MKTNRRQFMGGIGALAASTFPMPAFAQAKPKVVVVGGGPGGATVAKYVAKDGGIDVTLVEPAKRFTTCFHSNLYLGGFKTWEEITHSYDKIAKAYGIKHVRQRAAAIDRDKKTGAARQRHGRCLTTGWCWRPASTSSSTPCPASRRRPARSCRTPGRPARRRNCSSASSTRCRTARPS